MSKPVELTTEQIAELHEAFSMFDREGHGRGHVTAKDLGIVMRSMGHIATDSELKDMMNEVDADGNDCIEHDEFIAVMADKFAQVDPLEELQIAFNSFDLDGNGSISPSELKQVMVNLGANYTDKELDVMIKEADYDGDGLINFADFEKMMVNPFNNKRN